MSLRAFLAAALSLAALLHSAPAAGTTSPSVKLYVARNGNDAWSGRLPAPDAGATDGPFASLERARSEIRRIIAKEGLPGGGITVLIRGGQYSFRKTLLLEAIDSGEPGSPIIWAAYRQERVRLSGARPLNHLAAVRDPSILSRLQGEARNRVRWTRLPAEGITSFGEISQRGTPGLELFANGRRLPLARWPNEGWLRIADVPQNGDTLYNKGLEREKRFDGVPAGRHYGRITYDGDRPARWASDSDIFLHGFWTFDWSDSYQRVLRVDTIRHEITLRTPHHHYGYTKNQRYRVLNVLEEIDQPGEWYLDRRHGLLYVYPPEGETQGAMEVSVLDSAFIHLRECRNVILQGLHITGGRSKGIVISGGRENRVAGCTFDNLGDEAVMIDGGANNSVLSCDMTGLALGCVLLKGGDRRTLTPGRNSVRNCLMHGYSQWLRTGQYAVVIDGVADTISHNEIYDSPFEAIGLRGNEHVVEYNEVHDVTKETGDAGALHTGRDFTWRGNIIRYNYFHDLQGPGLHGVMGVYLDDWASGFVVYGNVFVRAGRATLIGGGRDNTVENNIYVSCSPSVHVDARGLGWAGYFFDGSLPYLVTKMEEMNYTEPPYSLRYPELLTLYRDEPAVPKNNRIVRNISQGGRWLDIYDYQSFDFSVVKLANNVIADSILLRRRADGQTGWDPYYLNIDYTEGYSLYKNGLTPVPKELAGNEVVPFHESLVQIKGDSILFADRALLERIGFKQIPFESIGTQRDEFRPDRKSPLVMHKR
jgi:hypothetical protein